MDLISDFVTAIRNGLMAKKRQVRFQHSRALESIAKILQEEGFVETIKVVDDPVQGAKKKTIFIYLKYGRAHESVMHNIVRISVPGRRVYVRYGKIPKVMDGFGISILSTSKGIVSSRTAKSAKVGGELMCEVW